MVSRLADLDVAGKVVLLRADFNVPLDTDADGATIITDDRRIRSSVPTIKALTDRGARVAILAHPDPSAP